MKRIFGSRRSVWIAALVLGALPFATLVPLGAVWLWQHGDLGLWFLGGALCFLAAGVLFRQAARPAPSAKQPGPAALRTVRRTLRRNRNGRRRIRSRGSGSKASPGGRQAPC
jgi:hypothetical protein